MTKDAVATMGSKLTEDVGGRDAVHVAVISVTAAEELKPGQHVGIRSTENGEYLALKKMAPIGIVDPFIEEDIDEGDRFWLYLYPRTITSLNHQWTHPAFPDDTKGGVYKPPGQQLISMAWLKRFCDDRGISADAMLKALKEESSVYGEDEDDWRGISYSGGYLTTLGTQLSDSEIPPEFWDHVEVVIGKRIPVEQRAEYFSCSC